MKCYCCGRTKEEVIETMKQIAKAEYEASEQIIKLEMETENKKIMDLQAEWEALKQKVSTDISSIFTIDIKTLLEGKIGESDTLLTFLKNAEKVIGTNLNPATMEREFQDKLDKMKNLDEFNKRVAEARRKYEMALQEITREKQWLLKREFKVGSTILQIPVCRICSGAPQS
jgi:hypothetical protein